jgi:hypothetical protein
MMTRRQKLKHFDKEISNNRKYIKTNRELIDLQNKAIELLKNQTDELLALISKKL